MSTVRDLKRQQEVRKRPLYTVAVASTEAEIEACLKLRFRVFAEELGARLKSRDAGIDEDEFDAYCRHLMVLHTESGQVIATTRLLTEDQARKAGGFYSETEFAMPSILALPGRIMEIGRTCIDAEHRSGSALNALWQGIAQAMTEYEVDYLIGCASIPASDGGRYALSVMDYLRRDYLSSAELRVQPYCRLPQNGYSRDIEIVLPRLLKTYLRCGALVCGELYWDTDFNVADAFILLERKNINVRFARHFLGINA